MKDCVGNDIHEGAILKVFHFYGSRKRKHFMYKQIGAIHANGMRKIHHLPYTEDGYYVKSANDVLIDSVVVSCECEFHIYNNLKISKFHGS